MNVPLFLIALALMGWAVFCSAMSIRAAHTDRASARLRAAQGFADDADWLTHLTGTTGTDDREER